MDRVYRRSGNPPEPIPHHLNSLTERIIGCAIEVHRTLGPGLLESAYECAFSIELASAGLQFLRQVECPVDYRGHPVGAYRFDLLVEGSVLVEVKSVNTFERIFVAQILTYLRATGCRLGLIINFNVPVLKEGIKRVAL
jgi:GxxExxY protein